MTITAEAAIKEALASAPSPSPWRRSGWRVEIMNCGSPAIALRGYNNENADARFIAACNPEAMAARLAIEGDPTVCAVPTEENSR